MLVHFINLYGYLEKDYIAQKCLESWQKNMPNAKFKIWTENDEFMKNILNKKIKFLEYANEKKNKVPVAMLCDYLKLKIIYEFGGMISEFDQILVKNINIDEEVEFCDMIISLDIVTSEHLPYYFKKGNKILKYLIDEIENNFDEDWFDIEKCNQKHHHGQNELSLCSLRNLPSDLFKDLIKLRENSKRVIDEIGYFAAHISNWWMYRFNKIVICYGFDLLNQYKGFIDRDTYFVVIDGESKYHWRRKGMHHKTIDISYKDLFVKSVKYEISKSPELKNKFIDVNNILGDLNNISFKDFELC